VFGAPYQVPGGCSGAGASGAWLPGAIFPAPLPRSSVRASEGDGSTTLVPGGRCG
jgi:hypothetical protein